jgi:hypothetical protein
MKSTRNLSAELQKLGRQVSHVTAGKLSMYAGTEIIFA